MQVNFGSSMVDYTSYYNNMQTNQVSQLPQPSQQSQNTDVAITSNDNNTEKSAMYASNSGTLVTNATQTKINTDNQSVMQHDIEKLDNGKAVSNTNDSYLYVTHMSSDMNAVIAQNPQNFPKNPHHYYSTPHDIGAVFNTIT